ncbi:hypothetical protein [Helicobacter sp.]|nr:hypothetical protein [Helicobacter sp.]
MAIYNTEYKNFYNGIFKTKGEILSFGLPRIASDSRNDAIVKL